MVAHYKQDKNIILETDLSDYDSSKIFFCFNNNEFLYLMKFFSKNFNPADWNYEIYEIE